MSDVPTRRSPIHHLLKVRRPEWGHIGGAPVAISFGATEAEQATMQSLGLCDLSALPKLGVKGPGSESWLRNHGVDLPVDIYESHRLGDGGFIVRLAVDEFLLESGIANESVPALAAALGSNRAGVFRVERQDATFLLVGPRSLEVLARTCGIDFHEASPQRLIFTRVAGVGCGVFPHSVADARAFRFWVDPSYAVYLWETLMQICENLDGRVIGAGCLFPELR